MSMLLEPPIVLRGELSMADVLTANRMMRSNKRRATIAVSFFVLASIVVSVGLAVRPYNEVWSDWIFGAGFVVLLLIFFLPVALERYRLHLAWKRKVGVFHQVETTINNDGLLITEPHTVIQVEWPRFIAALTSPTVIFLFPGDGWILFGRSRFADEYDWNRFRAFVDDRYPIKPRLV